jgi:hypothetical protein
MTKEQYRERRRFYMRLPIRKLESTLEDLYNKRYFEYDIGLEADYRIASAAYVNRTKTGESLIYHLKNFLGSLVF